MTGRVKWSGHLREGKYEVVRGDEENGKWVKKKRKYIIGM